MTSEELAAAASSFRGTMPLPEDAELQAALAPPILHDLVKVLKICCSAEHPLTQAKKTACMFFFGAVTEGEPYLERMKRYDGMPPESRGQLDSAWEQVLAAVEGEQQPRFQYMSVLRQADRASGMRTFDRAVGAFGACADVLLSLDEARSEDDRREVGKKVHWDLYSQPDDTAYVRAALAEALQPEWWEADVVDREDFRFIQYFHRSGLQLDVNVGTHFWVIVGGPSGGGYGGTWREQMVVELIAAARKAGGTS